MEAFAPTACRHTRIRLKSEQQTDFVDLTDWLKRFVRDSGLRLGFVNLQSLHTTVSVVVNENEPLLLADFAATLDKAAPAAAAYRHDDVTLRTVNLMPGERVNGHAHCRALFLGLSACINVVDGELQLGRWQRVFAVELDGPQHRELSVILVGEGWQ